MCTDESSKMIVVYAISVSLSPALTLRVSHLIISFSIEKAMGILESRNLLPMKKC